MIPNMSQEAVRNILLRLNILLFIFGLEHIWTHIPSF